MCHLCHSAVTRGTRYLLSLASQNMQSTSLLSTRSQKLRPPRYVDGKYAVRIAKVSAAWDRDRPEYFPRLKKMQVPGSCTHFCRPRVLALHHWLVLCLSGFSHERIAPQRMVKTRIWRESFSQYTYFRMWMPTFSSCSLRGRHAKFEVLTREENTATEQATRTCYVQVPSEALLQCRKSFKHDGNFCDVRLGRMMKRRAPVIIFYPSQDDRFTPQAITTHGRVSCYQSLIRLIRAVAR